MRPMPTFTDTRQERGISDSQHTASAVKDNLLLRQGHRGKSRDSADFDA